MLVLSGCTPIRDPKDLHGRYQLTSKTSRISLEIHPDHTYVEIVDYADGASERTSDRWDWSAGCLLFKGILLPELNGIKPNDVMRGGGSLERSDFRKTARGTDQLDWCFGGEKSFGKTKLIPYPDKDIEFQMITPY